MRMRYPFAAQTKASDVPVLPPVYSTTVSPGRSLQSASARVITDKAIRSFMLPVGFSGSTLTSISRPLFGSGTSHVFPVASRLPMAIRYPMGPAQGGTESVPRHLGQARARHGDL